MNDRQKAILAIAVAGAAAAGIYAYTKMAHAKTPPGYAQLTVSVNGQGSVDVYDNGNLIGTVTSSNSFNIAVGDQVTLSAIPAQGWQFSGFST